MPPRRSSKKAKTGPKEAGSAVVGAVVENLLCPITSALPVCPVVAEDGHVYEKAAIERWLSRSVDPTSPLTREPMGERLVDSTHTRTLILTVIEGGAVDDDAAAAWHFGSAKAIKDGKLTGARSSVRDHLDRADALSSSPEIKLSLKAVDLKVQQDALLKESADTGTGVVAAILGGDKIAFAPMREWRELREGTSVIRVIDDAAKVERLCERKAPGADAFCGWRDPKAQCCGKFYVVKANRSSCKGYHIENPGTFYVFPFDAVSLMTF